MNYWRHIPNSKRVALQHFTAQFYSVSMGTGVLGVLLNRNPYQFRGLYTISVVAFIITLVLFITFTILFLTRWILFRKSTAKLYKSDPEQTTYLSTIAISAATLSQLISLICGASWYRWEVVSYAFWWVTVVIALGTAMTCYYLLARDQHFPVDNLLPTLMLPVTGIVATAAAGSVLISYTGLPIHLAQSALIVSYMLLGVGFILSIVTITAYIARLLSNQNPPPAKAAGEFVPTAAFSNTAYSYAALSYLAGPQRYILSNYGKGPVSDPDVGRAMFGAGFMMGLAIFGFATFWLLLAFSIVIRDVKKVRFNKNMWSGAYPLGAYGLACSQFAIELDSTAFRVVTSIVLVLLVIYWLVLVAFTIPSLISGELLLSEAKEEMDKEKHHKEEGRASGETAV